MTAWVMNQVRPDPHRPNAMEVWLEHDDMTAKIHLSGRGSRSYIVVSFSSDATAVAARAEAHRFTAATLDAMVEYENENGIPCEADTPGPLASQGEFEHGRQWVSVQVMGRSALEVVSVYFGDALDENLFDGPGPGR